MYKPTALDRCFRHPDLIASEQAILTLADGLLAWMIQVPRYRQKDGVKWCDFITHVNDCNPGRTPLQETADCSREYMLERFDPDANHLLAELLRHAWHRSAMMTKYGERHPDAQA